MKRQRIDLPERRVELYDKYVETLLKHWNLARSLGGRGSGGLDVLDTLRVLAPLALWMHETSPGVGLVKERALSGKLAEIYSARRVPDPERAAEQFLADLREHVGLLLARAGRQYGFIHLTFQEYLAAVALAQRGQTNVDPVVDALSEHIQDDNWHEVSLLKIGHIGVIQQREEAAGAALEGLLERGPGKPGEVEVLCGEAVADLGAGSLTPDIEERVVQDLVVTLCDDSDVPAVARARAGQVLAACGDPRTSVTTLGAMEFCYVPAGVVVMGSKPDETDARESESPSSPNRVT